MSNIFELARLSIKGSLKAEDLRIMDRICKDTGNDTLLTEIIDAFAKLTNDKLTAELLVLSRKIIDDGQFVEGVNTMIEPSANDAYLTAIGLYDNYVLTIFDLCIENDWDARWTRIYERAADNRLFAFRLLEIDAYWYDFRSRLFGDKDSVRDEYHQQMNKMFSSNGDDRLLFIDQVCLACMREIQDSSPAPIDYNGFQTEELKIFVRHLAGLSSNDPWIAHEAKLLKRVYESSEELCDKYSKVIECFESLGERDPLYNDAVSVTINNGIGSISLIQRHLHIGFNRAGHMLQDMMKSGIVVEVQIGTFVLEGVECPQTRWIVPD